MKQINIEAMCHQRLVLIDQLERGELCKETFILENHRMLETCGKVSYEVSSVDEGIFKYHYFNTMAKKAMLDADAIEFRAPEQCFRLKELAYAYYTKKDRITLNLLEYVSFNAVKAYHIHMNSRHLEGEIYEIDFFNCDRVVLHSKDKRILHKLKVSGCFVDERMDSKVKAYVNTKIY